MTHLPALVRFELKRSALDGVPRFSEGALVAAATGDVAEEGARKHARGAVEHARLPADDA
eukprot:7378852-Prymnesium_polylepis.1